MDLQMLAEKLRRFAADRDWEQFHSPKNLASALIVEAGELLEIFQWLKDEESGALDSKSLKKVREEIADIQIYLIRLADVLGIDMGKAVEEKIAANSRKYPVEKAKGSAKKYDEL